jgi:hypothetical protein
MNSNHLNIHTMAQAMRGEAPRHLLMCPKKCDGHAGKVVGHARHVWCCVLQCGTCPSEWNICVACSSGHGSHLRMGRVVLDHAKLKSYDMAFNVPKETHRPQQHIPKIPRPCSKT